MFLTKYRPVENSLYNWRPFMSNEFDNFLENFFSDSTELKDLASPNIDLYDDGADIVVKAEIPGVNEKEIDVSLEDGILSLKGERKFENEDKKENYYRIERKYGIFSRSLRLPTDVKDDKATAKYKNGVLEIRIPKEEKAKAKKIKVDVN